MQMLQAVGMHSASWYLDLRARENTQLIMSGDAGLSDQAKKLLRKIGCKGKLHYVDANIPSACVIAQAANQYLLGTLTSFMQGVAMVESGGLAGEIMRECVKHVKGDTASFMEAFPNTEDFGSCGAWAELAVKTQSTQAALGLSTDISHAQTSLLQSCAHEEQLSTLTYGSEGRKPRVAAGGGKLVSKLKSKTFANRKWRKGNRGEKSEEKIEGQDDETTVEEVTSEEEKNQESREEEQEEATVDGKQQE